MKIFLRIQLLILLSISFVFIVSEVRADLSPSKVSENSTYQQYLSNLDTLIRSARVRVAKRPNEWLIRQTLVSALFERASLTNNLEDYKNTDFELNAAFKLAPKGSGPLLIGAKFNYSVHRLNKAQEYLDLLGKQRAFKAADGFAANVLRAEIAFQRGEYKDAYALFLNCESVLKGACAKQLAIYFSRTGDLAKAEAIFREISTSKNESEHSRAWLSLQLGIIKMEQGKYLEALSELTKADEIFPGWWLVEEHIAEVQLLLGRVEEARTIYLKVVEQTGLPQYLDALTLLSRNFPALSLEDFKNEQGFMDQEIEGRANKLWLETVSLFPESAQGHAIDHFLDVKKDFKQALTLARENYKNRPNGEAGVTLAKCLIANGDYKEGRAIIDKVLSSEFRSAELFAISSQIYGALGEEERAKIFKETCLAINPEYFSAKN